MTQTGVVSWSQTAATNASADTNVNWAEGMAPSQVNDSARAEMASVAKWRDDTNGTIITTGSSAAFTATSNQNFSALTVLDGQRLRFRFKSPNSASATLNVDGLGAKPLQVDATNAVPAGRITTDSVWDFTYDNTAGAFIAANAAFGAPGMTLIQQQSVSNVATVDFATGLTTFYDHYLLKVAHAIPASITHPALLVGQGGGPTYASSSGAYQYAFNANLAGVGAATDNSASATAIIISNSSLATTSAAAATAFDADIKFSIPTSTSAAQQLQYEATYITTGGVVENIFGSGVRTVAGATTGIRFFFLSGNVQSGVFSLYGYAKG